MKKLIATTALALIIGGPAAAQATQDQPAEPQAGQPEAQAGQQPQGGQTQAGDTETAQDQPETEGTQTETAQTGAQQPSGQDQQMAGGAFYQPQQDDQLLSEQGDQGQQATEGDIAVSNLMDAAVYAPQTRQDGGQQGGGQEQAGGQQPTDQEQQQAAGGQQEQQPAGGEQEQQAAGGQTGGDAGGQQPQTAQAGAGGGGSLQVTQIAEDELQEMQEIGTVTDVIVSQQGDVQAIVVEVGGFLGEGAREVALSADQLTFGQTEGEQGELVVITQTPADELQNAPAFQRADAGGQQQEQQQQASPEQAGGEQPMTAETGEAEGDGAEVIVVQEGEQAEQDQTEVGEAEGTTTEEVEIEATESEELQPADEVETATEEEMPADEVETATEEMPADAAETGEAEDVAATDVDTGWRGEREALVAPTLEREGFTQAEASEISVETLMGTDVYDTNDESIGSISDVVMDADGAAQFAVVSVGGFLGLGARSVAIGFDEMQVLQGEGDELRAYVDATQEMIESMPEYEAAEN